jgi:hypothetical protein
MSRRVYRTEALLVLGPIMIVLAVARMTHEIQSADPSWVTVALNGVVILGFARVTLARVVASETGLLIVDPLRTRRLSWTDIAGFDCVGRTARVRLRTGSSFRLWAVSGWGSSASHVAELEAMRQEARTKGVRQDEP